MNESPIVAKIRHAIAAEFPEAVFRKLNDRVTRGLPDVIIRWRHLWLMVEVKRPEGKETKLQAFERERCNAAGGLWLLVTSPDDVLAVLRYWEWIENQKTERRESCWREGYIRLREHFDDSRRRAFKDALENGNSKHGGNHAGSEPETK